MAPLHLSFGLFCFALGCWLCVRPAAESLQFATPRNRPGTEWNEETARRHARPFVTVLFCSLIRLTVRFNGRMNIVSQAVLIKFVNEPTVTYKSVRAHELRLLRIGNSNLTRLPWSIWGKSGGATEVGTVDINSSCNSTKTETASHSLPKLSHCNVVSFTSSPVLSTICNTTHTL